MKKIVFENMPETYEKGNLIFFKEPYKVDAVIWGIAHPDCKSLILKDKCFNGDMNVYIIAFPKSPANNIELYSVLDNDKDKYSILNAYGGGSITEVF